MLQDNVAMIQIARKDSPCFTAMHSGLTAAMAWRQMKRRAQRATKRRWVQELDAGSPKMLSAVRRCQSGPKRPSSTGRYGTKALIFL